MQRLDSLPASLTALLPFTSPLHAVRSYTSPESTDHRGDRGLEQPVGNTLMTEKVQQLKRSTSSTAPGGKKKKALSEKTTTKQNMA